MRAEPKPSPRGTVKATRAGKGRGGPTDGEERRSLGGWGRPRAQVAVLWAGQGVASQWAGAAQQPLSHPGPRERTGDHGGRAATQVTPACPKVCASLTLRRKEPPSRGHAYFSGGRRGAGSGVSAEVPSESSEGAKSSSDSCFMTVYNLLHKWRISSK